MKVIYETSGRAREYCELAANLYKGCGHGCKYCYAPKAIYCSQVDFQRPRPREGVLAQLQKDVVKLSFLWGRETRPILMSFSCDPYQPIDMEYQLTRKAIQILKRANLTVALLTKGGKRAQRDFDLLTAGDLFGVTMTCLDDQESLQWEPGAGLPWERIESLKLAKLLGIQTWMSLEPVIDPAVTLEIIRQTHNVVDRYKVGVMNYHNVAREIDWSKFAKDVVDLLERLGCQYYLKRDLQKWLSKNSDDKKESWQTANRN